MDEKDTQPVFSAARLREVAAFVETAEERRTIATDFVILAWRFLERSNPTGATQLAVLAGCALGANAITDALDPIAAKAALQRLITSADEPGPLSGLNRGPTTGVGLRPKR